MLGATTSEDQQIILFDPLDDLETSMTQVSDVENVVDIAALENISDLDTSQQRLVSDADDSTTSTDIVNISCEIMAKISKVFRE
ncbi:hypothetical protein DAPPUDRAFT_331238 [Daphnia pulex]|uniref:Uncharacterized protein n=1 Tax=Daphnia pulex TaxID=6669 RepID=E9HLW2_DAPPU|nr:hypothetical protein DAPPUDRAFT_331238 [Daphnia pulex]|eukprot:EFX67272.1 hypothetical protein DAPPUDRAFT_331238 [Daphnia pulex]